jgi:hypothetical protein
MTERIHWQNTKKLRGLYIPITGKKKIKTGGVYNAP